MKGTPTIYIAENKLQTGKKIIKETTEMGKGGPTKVKAECERENNKIPIKLRHFLHVYKYLITIVADPFSSILGIHIIPMKWLLMQQLRFGVNCRTINQIRS